MTLEQLLAAVQEEFDKELATKTAWGRNEVRQAFERAKSAALIRFLSLK